MEPAIDHFIRVGLTIFVGAPGLVLIFIGLVTLIIRAVNEEMGRHPPGHKSVETLINEAKGYGSFQPDPVEDRVKEIVKDGQQQVEAEVMTYFDDVVTIIKRENHR